jgi:hypothetical protein
MIVAIERNLFNYVLKYNFVNISNAQIFDIDIEKINFTNPTDFVINEFNRILPVFEQDQEILILEVNKNKLQFNSLITLSFESIKNIFPLTDKAKNVLSGKLNQNLELNNPYFEKIVDEVKVIRAIKYRELAFSQLTSIYNFSDEIDLNFNHEVKKIIIELLNGKNSTDSYLFNLLQYNYTPNEISSGNIEYLEKIGIIAFTYKAKSSDGYINSPFYIACERYKKEINKSSFSEGYITYHDILSKEKIDSQWKQSDKKIKAIVSEQFVDLDLFKISYYFLAIKSKLNKNDTNLIEVDDQIIRELVLDNKTMIHVLYLICYTFSINQLYESIHILSKAQLFNKKFLKRDVLVTQNEILAELNQKAEQDKILITENEDKDLVHLDVISEPIKINESVDLVNDESLKNKIDIPEPDSNIIVGEDEVKYIANDEEEEIKNDSEVDEVINSEIVTEPIVLYENINTKANSDIENGKNDIPNDIEENGAELNLENDTNLQSDKLKNVKLHSVKDFKIWILKSKTETKQKHWFDFLDTNFPHEEEIINLETVLYKLGLNKDRKKKILPPTTKEHELLKDFFAK